MIQANWGANSLSTSTTLSVISPTACLTSSTPVPKTAARLDHTTARDIFWMLTGRDIYRMLVRERGWSSKKYQEWLADTLVRSLLTTRRETRK
jgi:hypothetical protein